MVVSRQVSHITFHSKKGLNLTNVKLYVEQQSYKKIFLKKKSPMIQKQQGEWKEAEHWLDVAFCQKGLLPEGLNCNDSGIKGVAVLSIIQNQYNHWQSPAYKH